MSKPDPWLEDITNAVLPHFGSRTYATVAEVREIADTMVLAVSPYLPPEAIAQLRAKVELVISLLANNETLH